jgi:hypothetical protein
MSIGGKIKMQRTENHLKGLGEIKSKLSHAIRAERNIVTKCKTVMEVSKLQIAMGNRRGKRSGGFQICRFGE